MKIYAYRIIIVTLLCALIFSFYINIRTHDKVFEEAGAFYNSKIDTSSDKSYAIGHMKGSEEGYNTGYKEGFDAATKDINTLNPKDLVYTDRRLGDWDMYDDTIYQSELFDISFKLNNYFIVYNDDDVYNSHVANKQLVIDAISEDQASLRTFNQVLTAVGFISTMDAGPTRASASYDTLKINMSLNEYIDFNISNLEKSTGYSFTLVEKDTELLADKTFTHLQYKLADDLYQDFYLYQKGYDILVISITYRTDTESIKYNFLSGITTYTD